ncbi:General stress protein 16U [compost metagenome]
MSIVLTKGGSISLDKEAPGITTAKLGLKWDVSNSGSAVDLDAAALLLNAERQLVDTKNFVYFGNLSDSSKAVTHSGDNLTGEGDGDDEVVTIDLTKVPADVAVIPVAIVIFEAEARKQTFGLVNKASARVLDGSNGDKELAVSDLSEDHGQHTIYIPGEFYRHGDGWKYKAIDQGLSGGFKELLASYGYNV